MNGWRYGNAKKDGAAVLFVMGSCRLTWLPVMRKHQPGILPQGGQPLQRVACYPIKNNKEKQSESVASRTVPDLVNLEKTVKPQSGDNRCHPVALIRHSGDAFIVFDDSGE
ncbi:hypothetical protein [uncultured Cardiobacterium sp.]|uniref:hypothetical protein n=1 Tax=uncultured Cardiobacterium sp. TaxID=417619 RepID=UPI002621D63F|nr:hypothetical protein [uncultured Cardiobacterium sp.]